MELRILTPGRVCCASASSSFGPLAARQFHSQCWDKLNIGFSFWVSVFNFQLECTRFVQGEFMNFETPLADDICCISDPHRTGNALGSKLRARANLLKFDFYERFQKVPEATTYKLTVLQVLAPRNNVGVADLATDLLMPKYQRVLLGVFGDKQDAMIYRLAMQ
ncbi:MAG: hypothetical protein EOP06_22055 [Proteobacteria bacterium]|nr:MAG: hypothetical protein EOP06_22055 [Pseudomonadota bacterium]